MSFSRAEAEESGASAYETQDKTAAPTTSAAGGQEELDEEPVNGEAISTQQSQMDTPPPVQYHGQQRRKPSVQVIAGDEAHEFLSKLSQEKIDSDLANEAFWLDISVEELVARKEAGFSSQSQSQPQLQSPDDLLGPSSAPDPFHQPRKGDLAETPLGEINANTNTHSTESKAIGKRRASQSTLDDTATAAAAVHAQRERRMFRFKHSRSFHELTEDDGQHDEAYRAFFLGLTVKELRAREGRSKKRTTKSAASENQENRLGNKPALKRSANSAPSTHEVVKQQADKEEEEKQKKEDFAKAMSVMEAVADTMLPAEVKIVPRTSRRYTPSTPYTSYQVERIQTLLRDNLFFEKRMTPLSDEHLGQVHGSDFVADHCQVSLRQEETFS